MNSSVCLSALTAAAAVSSSFIQCLAAWQAALYYSQSFLGGQRTVNPACSYMHNICTSSVCMSAIASGCHKTLHIYLAGGIMCSITWNSELKPYCYTLCFPAMVLVSVLLAIQSTTLSSWIVTLPTVILPLTVHMSPVACAKGSAYCCYLQLSMVGLDSRRILSRCSSTLHEWKHSTFSGRLFFWLSVVARFRPQKLARFRPQKLA